MIPTNNFLYRHSKYFRYQLLLSFITFAILFVATTAHGAWYPDSNWQYRKEIRIQGSKVVGGPHSNFPVLIQLASDTDLAARAQDDGDDILFTSSNETTKIPHEIESFNGSTGALVAWVQVDLNAYPNNTIIYMYYGYDSATNQEDAVNVWDSNYKGVWHLKETSGTQYDSTQYGNDGTASVTTQGSATGKINGADGFSGTLDRVEVGTSSWSASQGTLELWGYPTATAYSRYFFGHTTQPAFNNRIQLYTDDTSGNLNLGLGDNHNRHTNIEVLTPATWYHIVLTWDGSNYIVYVNGVSKANGSYTGLSSLQTFADIGNDGDTASRNEGFNGIIDEVRISTTLRSANWIKTSYNNQVWPNTAVTPSPTPSPNPGGGFITVYSEVSGGGGGNQAPTVDAGSNQTITLPAGATLSDASASDSDGPSGLTYTWTKESGPGTVTFTPGDDELQPTASFSMAGTYVLKLSAYDGETWGEDTITITVNAAGSVDVSGYSCNMKITIKGSQVQGGPHNDFPVLISLQDDSLTTSGCGFVTSDDGYDILFTNSSKSSQLDHEIEKYDKDTGELLAWVKVDLNAYPTNTDIYMYYGKSGAGDQQNPTGVWDSSVYEAVYHLQGDFLVDSTSNNHDSTGDDTQPIDGRILGGQDFGPQDEIAVGNWSVSGQELTLQAWANFHDFDQDDPRVISKANDTGSEGHVFMLGLGGWNDQYLRMRVKTGTSDYSGTTTMADSDNSPTYPLSANTWYLIAGTYDGSYMRLYRNGVQVESTGKTGNLRVNSWDIALGNHPGNTSGTYTSMDGWLDEVRIVKKARSSDWLTTEYNNQHDPSSFYNVEKNCPEATPPISEFACSIPITIYSSKVSGISNLVNFPVLISLTNTSLKSTANCGYVQNSNGYDIIFSDSSQTTRLDHEIEKYDSASGELVAWVRIPTLSVENDTTIYVHFGHSGVCGSLENPTGVWDSNYVGVWHLDDQSNIEDSTSYNNDGTPSHVNDDTGKIAVGQDFDGNDYVESPDSSSLDLTSQVTLSAWIKPSATDYYRRIVAKSHSSAAAPWTMYGLLFDNSGHLRAEIGSSGNQNAVDGITALPTNTWTYATMTYNGSNIRLYFNGSEDATPTALSGNIDTNNVPLSIGRSNFDSDYFNGIIDEVRVSDIARSADWIKTSYNNQSDPVSFYNVGVSSCFLGGFSCNRKITIPGDNVSGSGNLTDFPLLIKIENDCNLKTSGNGGQVENTNGYDILFTDSSGAIQLDHEIEEYDGVKGDLTAWVKIPTLYGSGDTDIYMYYGKSGLTCDPSNPAGVWDSNYKSVWHLEEDPSATAPQLEDSSSNGNHGTSRGFMTSGDQVPGKIGGSLDFDGGDDYVSTAISFNNPQDLTVSAWFKTGSTSGKRVVGFESAQWGTSSGSWDRHIYVGTNGKAYFGSFSGSTDVAVSIDTLNDSTWHYAVGVRDGAANRVRLYIDGNLNDSTYNSAAQNYTGWWRIGSYKTSGWPNGQDGYFPGAIDEVRVSNTTRSADWIKTEYDNQRDPTSFSIMGNDSCGGQYGFNYQYCKKITVDHTQVNSDLTDFPLLVNITGDDDLKTVANGGGVEHNLGYDIIFRSPTCGQLDHEIAKYDGSAGTLIAWVRVPSLLAGPDDTEIYMYYGDSGVTCSPENVPGVWDTNYEAVLHLQESGNGSSDEYRDSTSNEHHGTGGGLAGAGNSYRTPSRVTGKFGYAQDFDGSNDLIRLDSVNDGSWTGVTVQAWISPDDTGDDRLFGKCWGTGSDDETWLLRKPSGGNFGARMRTDTGYNGGYDPGSLSIGSWQQVAVTWDASDDQLRVFKNGVQQGATTLGGSHLFSNSSGEAGYPDADYVDQPTLGNTPNNDRDYNGKMQEARVSKIARSADWLLTEYRNQNDPGNFYTIGSCFEQTTGVTQEWEEDVQ